MLSNDRKVNTIDWFCKPMYVIIGSVFNEKVNSYHIGTDINGISNGGNVKRNSGYEKMERACRTQSITHR